MTDIYQNRTNAGAQTEINLAILKTTDEGKNWEPVKPEDVPEFLKSDVSLTELRKGAFVGQGDGIWYQGVEVH